ncbi:purple acid phosphatase family protein [Natronosalvus vescus]|uniref:purple acid phosphatase family protein n=1 Tax=Natronosalvus vescus TaxID=2953881 RepID=UPI00209068A8|nr:metallophosphoesterase family protein [Natronosalvus vescus]
MWQPVTAALLPFHIDKLNMVISNSPIILFILSIVVVTIITSSIIAVFAFLKYERESDSTNDSPQKRRRFILRYTGIAAFSGIVGAIGGGLSTLKILEKDFVSYVINLSISERYKGRPPRPEGLVGIFLTWQHNPTTTMTIDWHTVRGRPSISLLRYRREDNGSWQEIGADSRPFPSTTDRSSIDPRTIHRAELTGLEPGTVYQFQVSGYNREYKFRTMPAEISSEKPLRFATGGDTMTDWVALKRVNEVAMKHNLDFIHWGGDLAYADADPNQVTDWFDWFSVNKDTLVTDEGRVIPILVAIGDHELIGELETHDHVDYEQTDEYRKFMAPFFYELFAFPGQPGYNSLDFGNYLSFIILDSNCSNPVKGQQTMWLEEQLANMTERSYVFTSYHSAAFPSHKDWNKEEKVKIRDHWVPLFEEYDITFALEHGDHTYKRSKPIRELEVSEDGIQYLGDGAWGVVPRGGNNKNEWYIDQFESDRHVIIVELDGSMVDVKVINEDENIIDQFAVEGRGSSTN